MNREEKMEQLKQKDFTGMKVRDVLIWARDNINGKRSIYDLRTKMCVEAWSNRILDMEVKGVSFHRGYGYGQIDTTVKIFKPKGGHA